MADANQVNDGQEDAATHVPQDDAAEVASPQKKRRIRVILLVVAAIALIGGAPVAIVRVRVLPIAFEVRHPLGAARAVPARRLQIGELFDRPHFDRHTGKARDRRRGRLLRAGIGGRDDERGRLRPARRDRPRLFVAALRQLDRREIVARHAGIAGGFAVTDEDYAHGYSNSSA